MRATALNVNNFRGIRSASLRFPDSSRILCLIGAGDSTKSTILQAIEYALWPNYSLNIFDTDFYNCIITEKIIIELTLTEIPDKLLNEDKFGLYLRGNIDEADDEPKDDIAPQLTVRLVVDETLEPQWYVITNRQEPRIISYKDRKLLCFGKIDSMYGNNLTWGRGSVLNKYVNSQKEAKLSMAQLFRSVASQSDFTALNEINDTVKKVAAIFGVNISENISSRFSIQSSSSLSSVGLFDNDAPLFQSGLGSQKLLSMGLQMSTNDSDIILLIDEIETGLEPYRIRSLINEFRIQFAKKDQIFITTHSHTTLVEMCASELYIIHSVDGVTTGLTPLDDIEKDDRDMQSLLRTQPEAFLSRSIIICEGKTEYGLLKALDNYLQKSENFRMASKGIYFIEGKGTNYAKYAKQLHKLHYKTCLLIDNDRDCDKKSILELSKMGIEVFQWDEGKSIEDQMFYDFDIPIINDFLQLAATVDKNAYKQIFATLGLGDACTPDFTYHLEKGLDDEINIKTKIGLCAKTNRWYKRIDHGEEFGNIIFQHYNDLPSKSKTKIVINALIEWVKTDDDH